MAITINGSGTITGISAGGLPDGSVTAADIESSLDLSGKTVTLPSGTGGKVLQVVHGSSTATQVIATSSFVSTAITASITPISTSSKILVSSSIACATTDGGGSEGSYFRLYRDGSNLWDSCGANSGSRYGIFTGLAGFNGDDRGLITVSQQHLDSPSSTSALTYTIYGRSYDSNYPNYINRSYIDPDNAYTPRGISTITLMEIAG